MDYSSGAATLASGTTSIAVTHSLGIIPSIADISITPLVGTASNPLFVDSTSVTATQFIVRTASAAAGNLTFAWQAKVNV
jgi:hypothetical protein